MSINGMEVTDVIIFPVKGGDGEVKAFAKIVLNDQFIINGIKIVDGENGLHIAYPQEYNSIGICNNIDVCFPVTASLRYYIADQVISQYKKVVVEPVFRNYNIGRNIIEDTEQFEAELKAVLNKYGATMETESFTQKELKAER